MRITEDIFWAHLKCTTKSYLKASGARGEQRAFTEWEGKLVEDFQRPFCLQLRSPYPEDAYMVGSSLSQALRKQCALVFDCVVQTPELQSSIPLLERVPSSATAPQNLYIPVRFIPREKLTPHDKLLLAFDALVLSAILRQAPPFGKIIHGSAYAVAKLPLEAWMASAQAVVGAIATQQANRMPPPLVLNKHCAACEFQGRCRQSARETDDLSLLARMTDKEIKKQHSKGIFSVTQLSYTFRARRRPKRLAAKAAPYSHALKALAIRERKIYIAGKPALKLQGTPVYFDVEGMPDRDFYYLIGLRVRSSDAYVQHSLWANDRSEEQQIWEAFLHIVASIDHPQLIAYGSYETTFLKRMKERYGEAPAYPGFVDQLIAASVNILSVIYAQIYFPTYSNSLKEIAQYLGCQWSESGASGLSAIMWRSQWEVLRESRFQQQLTLYNAEDCAALQRITECVSALAVKAEVPNSAQRIADENIEMAWAQEPLPETTRGDWGTPQFFHPDFAYINKCAYFDYQRDKVFLRTSGNIKKAQVRIVRTKKNRKVKVHHHIEIKTCICPFCQGTNIVRNPKKMRTKLLFDLKVIRHGMKGQVVAYTCAQHQCLGCGRHFRPATFDTNPLPHNHRKADKCLHSLKSWAMYQHVVHRTSFENLEEMIREYFGFNIPFRDIHAIKSLMADYYSPTYMHLLHKLISGRLIHADETEIKLKKSKGYVWVFTSLEEVVFMYKPTREGEFLRELLREYKGVLVSDFYGAYDSLPCAQQKCLVHLIRDVNNDILKNPFDEELKGLGQEFALLLRPMIETVDRCRLKARFLCKHKVCVEQFYTKLAKHDYQSDMALSYKKRFEKNRDKLFTFLAYDGVPWNNNNAEHAIKQFAHYRILVDGQMTEAGLNNYLVLLSVYQTCVYKGISFFRFLLSGERDLEKFAASRQHKQGGPSPHVMLGASLSEGVMGDKNKHRHGIMRGNGNRGEKSCTPSQSDCDEATADALKKVAEEIERSHSKEAAETFASFQEELQRPEPRKAVLRALWSGVTIALPPIIQMSDVATKVAKLWDSACAT
jgi:predicted RecB family nuclease